MIRVLITGSRTWTNEKVIHWEILKLLRQFGLTQVELIHGACPKGADAIADRFALLAGIPVVRHPADWHTFGKSAGYRRNAAMVKAGADYCFAFIKGGSPGATMTAKIAADAGIDTTIFEEE